MAEEKDTLAEHFARLEALLIRMANPEIHVHVHAAPEPKKKRSGRTEEKTEKPDYRAPIPYVS